jgi:hypothetical protein
MPPVDYTTPRELAERYRTDVHCILAAIKSGELRALNLAHPGSRRPRWRISPEALEAFEAARTSRPPVKAERRRRAVRMANVIQFI